MLRSIQLNKEKPRRFKRICGALLYNKKTYNNRKESSYLVARDFDITCLRQEMQKHIARRSLISHFWYIANPERDLYRCCAPPFN